MATTEKMRYPREKSQMGWNADQWAQDVYDKLNTGLLAVTLSFANEEGESRFSYMTNQRLMGQRLSLQALESLKADFAKQHGDGFIPVALYTVSLGEDWQFLQHGLAKLFERHEDGYSMVCECALPLPEDAHLNEEVLSEIRRSEERLYEKKLHPLFRDAAHQRTVMEEIAALGGKVTYNQDASNNLPRVVFDADGMVAEGRDVLEEIVNSGQTKLIEVVNKPADMLGIRRSSAAKVGRNDPCPCGSGSKYKKCCGNASLNPILTDEVLPDDEESSKAGMTRTLGKEGSNFMEITQFWLGTKVRDDGNLSDLLEDGYLALQHADWMTLTDEGGFPRATKPGDTFWCPFPVSGMEISLHNSCLIANDGTAELRLEQVDLSSVFPTADPLVAALIGMLQPPHEEPAEDIPTGKSDTGLSGSFGQGGRR